MNKERKHIICVVFVWNILVVTDYNNGDDATPKEVYKY